MANYHVAVNLTLWREYLAMESVYVTADALEANLTERRWPRVVRRWEAKHRPPDVSLYGILACDDESPRTYRPGHYFGIPRD